MSAPDEVLGLIERFRENEDAYKSKGYKEAELRNEFVNPLFEALGWDVRNRQGAPEPYKDVIHEASLKTAGAPKAPDYSFRFGGRRMFFVETKRPALNLHDDPSPAYQLRRYGWSAKLPVSILTDFEEFVVYDCRVRPAQTDDPSRARTMFLTYDQYADHWEEIAGIFSKVAIRNGSFDEYAERTTRQRGQSPVDEEFLEEIEGWRSRLAHQLAANNPDLTARQLNTATQRTIDRIVFLRICEDRGIEDYGQLQALIEKPADQIYPSLLDLYYSADDRYNSGLFHFREEGTRPGSHDTLTPNLRIPDDVLTSMIDGLYYPESPYEFSVLSPDILGQVYEQFLGRTIQLANGTAAVVDKPEVRKSGGVYYTPRHIVQYIVDITLGKLLEGARPDDVQDIRILDPACGSGSFLLGAYDKLLRWHQNWYVEEGLQYEKYKNRVYEAPHGEYRLTTKEKKRILLNSIYGVDIDQQAVEVTKLSLLLKLLEHETSETIEQQLKLFQERALPDLATNVKCGNSLVETDYYRIEQGALFDKDVPHTVNPFDWEQAYPKIMVEEGGFDIVIGNPPYVFGEYLNDETKAYFKREYELAEGQYDTYKLFIERGLDLLSDDGKFSMIVPDPILARDEAVTVRERLLHGGFNRAYHCGPVFTVNVSAVVIRAEPDDSSDLVISDIGVNGNVLTEFHCDRNRFLTDDRRRLLIHASDEEWEMIRRMEKMRCLGDVIDVSRGEELGKKHLQDTGPNRIIIGEDISPFNLQFNGRHVDRIEKDEEQYSAPKIVLVKTGKFPVAALDEHGYYTMQSVYNLQLKDNVDAVDYRYILGVLNSVLARYYIYKTFTAYKLLYPQLNQSTVTSIPLPEASEETQLGIVELVTGNEHLSRKLQDAKTADSREKLHRQIEAAREQLDQEVFSAFGLSSDERQLITQWA